MENKKTAWYLDEDVLLEGAVIKNRFYADRNICGFDIQEFDEDMTLEEMVLNNNMKKVGSIDRNGYFHSKESKIYDSIEDEEPDTEPEVIDDEDGANSEARVEELLDDEE